LQKDKIMKRAFFWLGGLAAVVLATGGLLWFATAGAAQFRVEGDTLYLSGTLSLAGNERFETLMDENPGLTTLILEDIPGGADITASLQKGYRIRNFGLRTAIAPGAVVAGHGVYLFLSGVERRMGAGATLLLEDWALQGLRAGDMARDAPAHAERRSYVMDMLGEDTLYWMMVNDAGRVIGADEAARLGLLTGG